MLIWALFAAMTAVAALIVLAALARRSPADAPSTDAGDVSVYRDQLAEIDRDLAAGLVAPSEAEAARAEIARRLIRAARTTDPSTEKRGTGRSRLSRTYTDRPSIAWPTTEPAASAARRASSARNET